MSQQIRLREYLAVEVDGIAGVCLTISESELAVDLPGTSPLDCVGGRGDEVQLTIHCAEDVAVSTRATFGRQVAGAPPSQQRYELHLEQLDSSGRDALVAAISSLRKTAHLSIAAEEDVEAAKTRAGWDEVCLPHVALPEAHGQDDIDLATSLFGRALSAPLMISGMTGGSERAGVINQRLAAVAQELGLALGLGSQRAMLETPELQSTFDVRPVAPDILLLANVGAVQFNYGVTVEDCRRLVGSVQADVLAIHLNPLQEMVQPEGDRDWTGLLRSIGQVVEGVGVPVLVKETGCGISGEIAQRLVDVGVAGIDVGGTGGTSWGWIEGFRAADPHRQAIGETFRDWGTPTADALRSCRAVLSDETAIVATGGLRTGLDVARAVALGADVGGMALPFFRAADTSADECLAYGARVLEELRIAMFCAGVVDVPSLRGLEVM